MFSRIDSLWRLSLSTFPKTSNGLYSFHEDRFAVLKKEMDCITPVDVCLEESLSERNRVLASRTGLHLTGYKPNAPVTFIDIYAGSSFSICIFVLHKGSHMPIHDHPHMHGLLKVLSGEVRLDSYTVVHEETCQNHGSTFLAEKTSDIVNASDPACVLTPKEKNLHSLSPVGGSAAFIDILSPPYYSNFSNVNPNPCNFYREESEVHREDGSKVYIKLSRTSSQRDYWCDTAIYKGPPLPDDNF